MNIAVSELILGGQKSGKSRRAEDLAIAWLAAAPTHKAVLIATAEPWDDEMRARIARHRQGRAARVPEMTTIEASAEMPRALTAAGGAETLRIVDCLTLWLTQELLPRDGRAPGTPQAAEHALVDAIAACPGPLVLVSNQIGAGVIPLGAETRAFVDALGLLNQAAARACERATLMVAGLPLFLKGAPCAA